MPSLSSFRQLTLPTVGGDSGIWGGELNATINSLDTILGNTVAFASSVSGTNVTLSSSQCQQGKIFYGNVSGGPAQLNIPASNGGFGMYTIQHNSSTAGLLTVTAGSSGTGGGSVTIAPNEFRQVWLDGVNASYCDYQFAGLTFGIDGVFNLPQAGAKPAIKVPFPFVIQSWSVITDTSSASGSFTLTAFTSSSPGGQNIATGGTTPTISGSENDGNVSGWTATYLPQFTTLTASLVSPANFTKVSCNLLGFKT
jgi:hypothetical protein